MGAGDLRDDVWPYEKGQLGYIFLSLDRGIVPFHADRASNALVTLMFLEYSSMRESVSAILDPKNDNAKPSALAPLPAKRFPHSMSWRTVSQNNDDNVFPTPLRR